MAPAQEPPPEGPVGSFLCPPGYAGPTGLRALAREGSALTEAARFVRHSARQRRHRRRTPYALRAPEQGLDPVVLVPGFLAGDGTLSLMSRHLRARGYRTYRSLMHANVGCTQEASQTLERRIEAIVCKRGRPVRIVGTASVVCWPGGWQAADPTSWVESSLWGAPCWPRALPTPCCSSTSRCWPGCSALVSAQ